MALLVKLVEGWTKKIPFRLLSDGLPQDLTGMTVELVLRSRDGTLIDTATKVTIDADQVKNIGVVYFKPADGDLLEADSPLFSHFMVTDQVDDTVAYPSGDPDKWEIRKK